MSQTAAASMVHPALVDFPRCCPCATVFSHPFVMQGLHPDVPLGGRSYRQALGKRRDR